MNRFDETGMRQADEVAHELASTFRDSGELGVIALRRAASLLEERSGVRAGIGVESPSPREGPLPVWLEGGDPWK